MIIFLFIQVIAKVIISMILMDCDNIFVHHSYSHISYRLRSCSRGKETSRHCPDRQHSRHMSVWTPADLPRLRAQGRHLPPETPPPSGGPNWDDCGCRAAARPSRHCPFLQWDSSKILIKRRKCSSFIMTVEKATLPIWPLPIHSFPLFEMAPSVSVDFISLVTSCVGLREELQTAFPMSFT